MECELKEIAIRVGNFVENSRYIIWNKDGNCIKTTRYAKKPPCFGHPLLIRYFNYLFCSFR